MAWSLIAHTIKTAATTNAINTTGADFIVIAVVSYSTTPITVSDSQSNTWTGLTEKTTTNNHVRLFYCQAPTTNSAHTFSTNANFYEIAVQAWSGSTTTPFDVQNGATSASSLTTQPGSITPSVNNELVISAIGQSADGATGTQTWTVNSSLTISDQASAVGGQHTGVAFGYFAQPTAAAINPTWTISSAADQAAVIASFKPAAGGGGTTFSASESESGSASDSETALGIFRSSLSESGSASDSDVAHIIGRASVSEAGSASDTTSVVKSYSVSVTETGSASDAVSVRAVLIAPLSESGSASDSEAALGGNVVVVQTRATGGGWEEAVGERFRKLHAQKLLAKLVRKEKKLEKEAEKIERKVEAERRQDHSIEGLLAKYVAVHEEIAQVRIELREVKFEYELVMAAFGNEQEEDDMEMLLLNL